MVRRKWAERVEEALAGRGVPAWYRRRLLAELRDHADDLTEGEGMTMATETLLESRLGEPGALANQAAEEFRRGRWASRHPLLTFGLLPLPALVLAFVATVLLTWLAAVGLAWLLAGDMDELPRPAQVTFAYTTAWGVRFVPFAVAAGLFTRLYLRSRVSRWWFAAAALQVLLVAGTFHSALNISDEPGESVWMIGLAWMPAPRGEGWNWPLLNLGGWTQAAQVVVPLAVGALLLRAGQRRRGAVAG